MYQGPVCQGGRSVIAAGKLPRGVNQASVSNIVRRVNVGLCAMLSLGETCMLCMKSVVQATFNFRPPRRAGKKAFFVSLRVIHGLILYQITSGRRRFGPTLKAAVGVE
jgi:hypothetical protein